MDTPIYRMVRKNRVVVCNECKRQFDLEIEEQANEWFYGHDCEV